MENKKCQVHEFGPYRCQRKGTVLMDDVGLKESVKVLLCKKCEDMVRRILKKPRVPGAAVGE